MKYLLKTTDTYRVDTLEEVERLRDEMEQSAWFDVGSFSYAYKYKPKLDEEYYVNENKHDIEYVCDYSNRFRVTRCMA